MKAPPPAEHPAVERSRVAVRPILIGILALTAVGGLILAKLMHVS